MPDPEPKPREQHDEDAPDTDEVDPTSVVEDHTPDDADVDDQGRDSFPASDPPANY